MQTTLRQAHVDTGVKLEIFTIAYNSLEGLVGVALGLAAGSIALIGFGLDSVIEVTSGAALLWRLLSDPDLAKRERAEQIALRIVGASFLALGAYVGYESSESLITGKAPERTIPGVLLAAASIIVMPILARAKRRIAGRIGSAALLADSKQTSLCTYLSVILLGGLGFNSILGWWWADPIAGLAMVPIIVKEGVDALRGKACCGSCH